MKEDIIFKILAVVSPFAAGFLTYLLTKRSKADEYLFQNRLPAFKEVAAVLIKLKKYCIGQIAEQQGDELSPYFGNEQLATSALMLRNELADVRQLNEVFLKGSCKELLRSVDEQLGLVCNMELHRNMSATYEDADAQVGNAYTVMLGVVEKCLTGMYKQVGLPS